ASLFSDREPPFLRGSAGGHGPIRAGSAAGVAGTLGLAASGRTSPLDSGESSHLGDPESPRAGRGSAGDSTRRSGSPPGREPSPRPGNPDERRRLLRLDGRLEMVRVAFPEPAGGDAGGVGSRPQGRVRSRGGIRSEDRRLGEMGEGSGALRRSG